MFSRRPCGSLDRTYHKAETSPQSPLDFLSILYLCSGKGKKKRARIYIFKKGNLPLSPSIHPLKYQLVSDRWGCSGPPYSNICSPCSGVCLTFLFLSLFICPSLSFPFFTIPFPVLFPHIFPYFFPLCFSLPFFLPFLLFAPFPFNLPPSCLYSLLSIGISAYNTVQDAVRYPGSQTQTLIFSHSLKDTQGTVCYYSGQKSIRGLTRRGWCKQHGETLYLEHMKLLKAALCLVLS